MTNLILCGGSGTRLWPLSRTLMPKQFVKLFDDSYLFQFTVERNSKLCKDFLIVSNIEQYFLVLDQLEELRDLNISIDKFNFLLEPIGRNTAPAIALSCMALDKEEIVLVTPSDHLIKDGNYLWNSGIFCFKAGIFLDELKKYSPDIYNACLLFKP